MNEEIVICGIQQVGIGVYDVVKAYNWYSRVFGFDIVVVDDDGVAERMLPRTGGKPRARRAIIAVNLKGGSALEIWQPKDGNITPPPRPVRLGDLGVSVCKVKTDDIARAYAHIKTIEGATLLSEVMDAPYGGRHFFMTDPDGNIFEAVESPEVFTDLKGYPFGGVCGSISGVSDMDTSMKYYAEVLGFDKVLYDATGTFGDFAFVPGGTARFRRVLLTASRPFEGPFSELYGSAVIELVQAFDVEVMKTFGGRLWGDPGFIQICFDLRNMDAMKARMQARGSDFICDGGKDFKMENVNGRFTYIEDPDDYLIELVETFRIPIIKSLGVYLNLANKDSHKHLPRWMVRALRFMRVRELK